MRAGKTTIDRSVRSVCEALESRKLLCALHQDAARGVGATPEYIRPEGEPTTQAATGGIVWANRGNDNFNATYGSRATAARDVVDAALFFWNRVISNFNQSGGDSQIDVTINALARGSGQGGSGGVSTRLGNKPRTSFINLGGGSDADGNGIVGDAEGFYLDASPYDYTEFQGNIINAFTGGSSGTVSGSGSADLFSLVTIELQHALGVVTNSDLAWAQDPNDYIKPAGTSHANAANDTVDTTGKLYTFNGPGLQALFTSNNGGPGGSDFGYAVHSARIGNAYTTGGVTYRGQDDTGVATYFSGRRYLPSYVGVQAMGLMYGYTVNPPQDVIGCFYAVPSPSTRQVLVRNPDPTSSDVMEMRSASAGIFITLNIGNDVPGTNLDGNFVVQFSRLAYDSVVMDGGGGTDYVRVDGNDNAPVTLRGGAGDDYIDLGFVQNNLDLINGTVFADGGTGYDRTFIYDANDTTADVWSFGTTAPTTGEFNVTGGFNHLTFTGMEEMNPKTGQGNDLVDVYQTPPGVKMYINSSAGTETVNVGKGAAAGTAQAIRGDIDIQNSPSFTTVNIDDTGDTTPRVVNTGTFGGVGNPFGYVAGLTGGVVYYKYADTTAINVTLGTPPIGSGSIVNVFETLKPITITGSNGQQRNAINVGNTTNGLNGILGSLRLAAIGFAANDVVVDNFNGAARSAAVLAQGAVGNEYTLTGFTGGGSITYTRTGFNSGESFVIRGGNAGETLSINNVRDQGFISFDGRGGFDSLTVDDRLQSFVPAVNAISATSLLRTGGASSVTFRTDFANLEAIGFFAHASATTTNITGVPASIPAGQQMTVITGGNADAIRLFPHDADGNLTINGNLGVSGGAGTDTMIIDDAAHAEAINYVWSNPFGSGTQNIYGLGIGGFGTAGIELQRIDAGSGDDTFAVNQFTSGIGLAINAGEGNDVLDFGNNNLPAFITSISSFQFNGQGGYDVLNLDNAVTNDSTSQWSYTEAATTLGANRIFGGSGYAVGLTHTNTESVVVNGTSWIDVLTLNAVPAGRSVSFNGNDGSDAINLLSNVQQIIEGPVFFDGGNGLNNINQLGSSSTVNTTVHITENTIGALPGDNFFAPGGAVYYGNVTSITLRTGSGRDTVFVHPSQLAAMNIGANNPTTSPGDTLNLALAGVNDYSVNPTSASAGTVTSSNYATLTYSGFEDGPFIDDTAPEAAAIDFVYDAPQQSIDLAFNEDVSATLTTGYFAVVNVDTGEQLSDGVLQLVQDSAAFTASLQFPGFANGVLPDGNYHVTFYPGYVDTFGNQSTATVEFDFFVLGGDANRDRTVSINDFAILASHFNQPGTFSQGDFNYSGDVGIQDFAILASNFGQTLSEPAPRPARPAAPPRTIFSTRPIHVIDAMTTDAVRNDVVV